MTTQVVSLGCRLNIAESETIRAMLQDAPETVVVNSCAVTGEAALAPHVWLLGDDRAVAVEVVVEPGDPGG